MTQSAATSTPIHQNMVLRSGKSLSVQQEPIVPEKKTNAKKNLFTREAENKTKKHSEKPNNSKKSEKKKQSAEQTVVCSDNNEEETTPPKPTIPENPKLNWNGELSSTDETNLQPKQQTNADNDSSTEAKGNNPEIEETTITKTMEETTIEECMSVIDLRQEPISVQWPDPSCSKNDTCQSLMQFYETNKAEYDKWPSEFFTEEKNWYELEDAIKNGIKDIPTGWEEAFSAAIIHNKLAEPIHVFRCLAPTKKAEKNSYILTKKYGLTADRTITARPGTWMTSAILDNYVSILNFISNKKEKDRFLCFHHIDEALNGKNVVNKNTKYGIRKVGIQDRRQAKTLHEILNQYHCVAIPINLSGSHWASSVIHKGSEPNSYFGRCYCSTNNGKSLVIYMKEWMQAQLPENCNIEVEVGVCPTQQDTYSCGERTLLNIQLCMFAGKSISTIQYDASWVNTFRYIVMQRILNFDPE